MTERKLKNQILFNSLLMCFPAGVAVLGSFLLLLYKIRTERAKGGILAYDRERETLELPRERLSLQKAQILEFRILREYVPREPGVWTYSPPSESRIRGNKGAAELRVVYRHPNEKDLTLLRAYDSRLFDDVVSALKAAGIARILLVEQQPDRSEWRTSEA